MNEYIGVRCVWYVYQYRNARGHWKDGGMEREHESLAWRDLDDCVKDGADPSEVRVIRRVIEETPLRREPSNA